MNLSIAKTDNYCPESSVCRIIEMNDKPIKLLDPENLNRQDDNGRKMASPRSSASTPEMKEAESPALSDDADDEEDLQILMEEARQEVLADKQQPDEQPARSCGPPMIPWTPNANDVRKSAHHMPKLLVQSAKTAKFGLSSVGMMDFTKYLLAHPSSDPLSVALSAGVMTAFSVDKEYDKYEMSVSNNIKLKRQSETEFSTTLREILLGLMKAHRATLHSRMPSQWTLFHTDAIYNSMQMTEWQKLYGGIVHIHPSDAAPEVEAVTLDEDRSKRISSQTECSAAPSNAVGLAVCSQPFPRHAA